MACYGINERCYFNPQTGSFERWVCQNDYMVNTGEGCTAIAPYLFMGLIAGGVVVGATLLTTKGGGRRKKGHPRHKKVTRHNGAHHRRRGGPYDKVVVTKKCFHNGRRVTCRR